MPRTNMGKTREQRIADKIAEQRKKIADKIAEQRKKIAEGLALFKFRNKLNELQLASILGVSRYTVSHILNQKKVSFTNDTVFKIIDAAGYELVKKEAAK